MRNRKSDIEKYLRGELTATEMHALEREALRDPFLAEALEGIDRTGHETFLFDLKALNKSVRQRTHSKKRKTISFSYWQLGVAATVILVAVSGAYLVTLIKNQRSTKTELASNEQAAQKKEEQKTPVDTAAAKNQLSLKHAPETKPSVARQRQTKPTSTQPLVTPSTAPAASETAGITEIAQAETEEKDKTKEPLGPIAAVQAKDSVAADVDPIAKKSADLASGAANDGAAKRAVGLRTFKSVFGKVTSSEDGSALPGVNVVVKGTRKGTVTDDEGRYQITLDDPAQNLVFSFIGLQPVETPTKGGEKIDVQMTPDFSQLSEIVVTGSGENSKSKTSDDDHPALQFAEPMGGRKAFQQYLENQLNYPADAVKNKIEGRVTVQFTVNPDGELGDFKVIKGLGYGCDDEVIRLIKEGPAWAPTKRDDQPVKDRVKIRLKFDLPD